MRRTWAWAIAICAGLSGGPIRADWPEFRGPDGQGHADGPLPLHWNEKDNVAWQQELPGVAWSSPVVVGGRVFLTTAIDKTPAAEGESPVGDPQIELNAACLSAETGEVLWLKPLFTQRGKVEIHKKNSHASPSPIVSGDALYVHFGPQGTARLTLAGDVVWTRQLEYLPTHGNGGSPALTEGKLIICCDGHDVQYVAALDAATGAIVWKTPRETAPAKGFSFCTPLVISLQGQAQAICPGSDAVFAYDPATGKEIWKCRYEGGYSVIPRPVYGNGLVYICTGYNKPSILAIDPTGTGDVTETHLRWKTDKQAPHSASLVLVGENLFYVSDKGIACCVDARTGDVHWEQRLGGNYSASPLAADGRIYFQDEAGTATVIAAAPEYQELARNKLPPEERTYASYAVSGGDLFIRSEKRLYRIHGVR